MKNKTGKNTTRCSFCMLMDLLRPQIVAFESQNVDFTATFADSVKIRPKKPLTNGI